MREEVAFVGEKDLGWAGERDRELGIGNKESLLSGIKNRKEPD
jgi:hypothetical protein